MSYEHLNEILPRAIFLGIEKASALDSKNIVLIAFPTKGMLQAEQLGYIECFHKDSIGLKAFRRTQLGQEKYLEYEKARKYWIKS